MGFGKRPTKPPQPPTIPPPTTTQIGISCWPQSPFDIIIGAVIRLDDDAGTTISGTMQSETRVAFVIPVDRLGTGATLKVLTRRGLGAPDNVFTTRVVLQGSNDIDIPASIPPIPQLTTTGQFFYDATTGAPIFVKGVSAFALQQILDSGADVSAVLQQYASLFNEVRVFTRYRGSLGRYDGNPSSWLSIASLAAQFSLRTEFVASADHAAFGWSDRQEVEWHQQLCAAVAGQPFVMVEGVNEGNHDANRFDVTQLQQSSSVMSSRGSGISDGGTMLPVFKGSRAYATYHPARKPDFARCVGHNAWEDVAAPNNVATKANEIMRPDENGFDVQSYFDAGVNAKLFITAATFHMTEGKAAALMNGNTLQCAQAFSDGCDAIDLAYRTGSYSGGNSHDCPIDDAGTGSRLEALSNGLARAHGRILGNRAAVTIPLKPAGWIARPKNDWRIVNVIRNNTFILER